MAKKYYRMKTVEKKLHDYYGYNHEEALSFLHTRGYVYVGDKKYSVSEEERYRAFIGEENYKFYKRRQRSNRRNKSTNGKPRKRSWWRL